MVKRETSEVALRDVHPWVSTRDRNRNQSLSRKIRSAVLVGMERPSSVRGGGGEML